jgi:hypothetical protein
MLCKKLVEEGILYDDDSTGAASCEATLKVTGIVQCGGKGTRSAEEWGGAGICMNSQN